MKINLKPINLSLLVSVGVLGVANVIATNLLATGGYELAQYAAKADTLEKENFYLTSQIASYQSLSLVETRAKELGFVNISNVISLSGTTPVAFVVR
jgi:hypothetical protein